MLPADSLKYNRMSSLIPSACNTSTGYRSPAGVRKLMGLGANVLMSACLMADTHSRDADHVWMVVPAFLVSYKDLNPSLNTIGSPLALVLTSLFSLLLFCHLYNGHQMQFPAFPSPSTHWDTHRWRISWARGSIGCWWIWCCLPCKWNMSINNGAKVLCCQMFSCSSSSKPSL